MIRAVLFEHRFPGGPPQPRPGGAQKNQHRYEEAEGCQLDTHNSQILKGSRRLDILQRRLQFPQLPIHPRLRLLRALHSLHFKRFNGFDLPSHIVRSWFEGFEVTFDLVDDSSVVEGAAVVLEVDGLGLRL